MYFFSNFHFFFAFQPSQIILGIVANSVYHGDLNKNPFCFTDHGLTFAALYVNGRTFPSPEGFHLSVPNGQYLDAYTAAFKHMPHMHSLTSLGFRYGSFLLVFDLDTTPGTDNGVVSAKFEFAASLDQTYSVLALATFNEDMYCDLHRNFSFSYTP